MVTLTGSTRSETITGGAGSDTINGGAGNDVIYGDNLVANGTFEGNSLDAGYNATVPAGWTRLVATNHATGQQVHPFADGAVQYMDTGNQTGVRHGLEQNTGVTYDATRSYNLTVDAGGQFAGPSPVTAQIMVGGIVIAEQTYSFTGFTAGSMVDNAINITLPTNASALSGAITIRIFIQSAAGAGTAQTAIDNVTLTATGSELGAADSINGGSGDDIIHGGAGDDTIEGGTGQDLLFGDSGNDKIYGGADADRLFGGAGDDYLEGGAGADHLFGGDGNDTLRGGNPAGNGDDGAADILTGGDGFDTFIVGNNDVIADFNFATGGDISDGNQANNDFVDLSGYYNAANLAIMNAASPASPGSTI